MARITRDEVVHVARLARLALTDEELDRFAGQGVRRVQAGEEQEVVDHAAHPGRLGGDPLQGA